MATGPEPESETTGGRAAQAGRSPDPSAAASDALAPLQQVGDETFGPLRLRRYLRPDGRALLMYERVDGA